MKYQRQDVIPAGWVMMRTPLLPFDDWLKWTRLVDNAPASALASSLEDKLAADKAALRAFLADSLTPPVTEALYMASPSFAESVEAWLDDTESRRGGAAETKLIAYFSRMTARPTPFGLFAGFTLGSVGEQTQLNLPRRSAYARKTRLDLRYLNKLVAALEKEKSVRRFIRFRPNSSLYPLAGNIRYFERVKGPGNSFSYRASVCEPSDYLSAVLVRAEEGATWDELVKVLLSFDAIAEDSAPASDEPAGEAEAFIDDLIENQILVSELRPALVGPEPTNALIKRMRAIRPLHPTARKLLAATRQLERIDARGVGNTKEDYAPVIRSLRGLDERVDFKESELFFVDLIKPSSGLQLEARIVNEIIEGIRTLHRLSWHQEKTMTRFAEAFEERFGTREVPLLEALDEESGVRFVAQDNEGHQFAERDRVLLRRVAALEAAQEHSLQLDESTVRALETSQPRRLIPCFSVFTTVMAESAEAVKAGRYSLYVKSYSPSASLFGRFCCVDEELRGKVEEMLRMEEATLAGAVHAEIVHYPAGLPLNNILCRPALRKFTIPVLAESAARLEGELHLSDLTVSVRDGRVIVKSVKLGREVIPHNSNAHAYIWGYNLPVYQFLCSLTLQLGAGGPVWSWGPVLESLPFLPRVVAGRLVVSKARWRVEKTEIEQLKGASDAELHRRMEEWRHRRRLPRFVSLAVSDNQLPVDLENILSVKTFISLVKNKSEFTFSEMLPAPDELCVRGPEGRFQHELVVPFICPEPKEEDARRDLKSASRRGPARLSDRLLLPCSDWLYAKIYASPRVADRLLPEVVLPLTRSLGGSIVKWFFIRYADPHHHLRLRFQCRDRDHYQAVLREFGNAFHPLLDRGELWRVQVDTYEREVERYGGYEGVQIAEEIFHADSRAVAELLAALGDEDAKTNLRICLGVLGVNSLLEDFDLGLKARMEIARRLRDGFRGEMAGDAPRMRVLGEKISNGFRTDREQLLRLVCGGESKYHKPLRRRSAEIKPYVVELREKEDDLSQPPHELLKSYVHMHVNRLLRFPDRRQELVIYDYLYRTLDFFRAREVIEARGVSLPEQVL